MHTYDIEFPLQIDDLKTVEVGDSLVSVMRLLDKWIATDKWWDCCVLRLIRRSSNQRVLSGADSNGCRPARWCHLRYCHALSGTGIFEVSCGPVLDADTRVCLSVSRSWHKLCLRRTERERGERVNGWTLYLLWNEPTVVVALSLYWSVIIACPATS